MFNSCQGKDVVVLFRLNYTIHHHTGIGCDTSLDSLSIMLREMLFLEYVQRSLSFGQQVDGWIV